MNEVAVVEVFKKLLARVRCQAHCYQTAHWRAQGAQFWGDHALAGKLYEEASDEIDAVAEKVLGVTGYLSAVDPTEGAALLHQCVAALTKGLSPEDPVGLLGRLLEDEKQFCLAEVPAALAALEKAGSLTVGVDNFIRAMADAHEHRVYLLRHRLSA